MFIEGVVVVVVVVVSEPTEESCLLLCLPALSPMSVSARDTTITRIVSSTAVF